MRAHPVRKFLNPMEQRMGLCGVSLDSACGIAVLTTLAEGQKFSTLELKVAYHKAIDTHTGLVRAEGNVLTRGRQIAYSEARLSDASGRLLASATSTLIILSR